MANGAVVIENGRVVRINLADIMAPGTRFTRDGIVFEVVGEGETAIPVRQAAAIGGGGPGSAGVGSFIAVAALIGLVWLFLKPKRGRRRR